MKPRNKFFVWLVPLLWATCSYVHYHYPGDEYALYAIGSIAAIWIVPLVHIGDIHNPLFPLSITLAGAVVMAAAGWIMDRLRTHRRLWAALYAGAAAAILCASLLAFPSIDRAIRKNGSMAAYVLFAANAGLYVSVVLAPILSFLPLFRPEPADPAEAPESD
ncbi:MAG: hypothetical protein JXR94_11080 [Candidatus Hydrogenedentes bacterium]|nr:hypothetical protein [Candidatus Hydrogenedentota bacterium]